MALLSLRFQRTEGTVTDNKTGKTFKTTKGAPHVLLKLVNNPEVHKRCEADVEALGRLVMVWWWW
jgi:H+-transporting ATPase